MRLRRIWLLYLLLAIYCCSCSDKHREIRRILVVHSYEESYSGYPEFNRLIEKQFANNGIRTDIRTIYLDCDYYGEETELMYMREMLDSVSTDWTPEVILVNEDQAAYSLMVSHHPLSQSVPIVFSGVNYPNDSQLKQHPNITGFHDDIDILKNIEVSKDLLGKTVGMFSILDYTYLDRQIRADISEQIRDSKIVGFDNRALDSAQLQQLRYDKEYTHFYTVGARVREGNIDATLMWALRKSRIHQCYIQLKRDYTTINIGNICSNPCLTTINEAFGFGERLLGGYITTLPIQVEESVGSAIRILQGEKPANIPITRSRKEYVVDWKVASLLKIPLDSIPAKYNFINISFPERHPVLWGVTIGIATLAIIIVIVWLFLLYRRELKRRRSALHALADEKQTMELAIGGSDTYAWTFENDHFVFENAFWTSQGVAPQKLTFEDLLSFFHSESQQSVLLNWDKNRVRKRIAQMRCDFNSQGYVWWEFRYTTVRLEDGTCRTAGLALNIQDVKDREQELDNARKLAEKAELKESFLANISHEIRTPLNAIVGFSNILVSDIELDAEDKQSYIDMINCNSDLLLKLVSDILELSRLESGSMSFDFSDCMVSELLDNIFSTHQMLIPKQLQFTKDTDDVRVQIHVDSLRLTQIITNFLNNASKFTESGSIKLGYNYLPNTQEVCIFVEDSGSGIPVEEQKAIFSRFYKRSEFSQGTGLGLSICQVIAEKLQGRIDLWSEPGKGSCFMVILPCKVVEE